MLFGRNSKERSIMIPQRNVIHRALYYLSGCVSLGWALFRTNMAAEISARDLDVEELTVTSAVLMGAAHHYGTYCKTKNDTFMQCRIEGNDPRKCLQEGKEVRFLI